MKKDNHNTTSGEDTGNTKPIKTKEQVKESNDEKIDQDFPGFPAAPATEETIKKNKSTTKI